MTPKIEQLLAPMGDRGPSADRATSVRHVDESLDRHGVAAQHIVSYSADCDVVHCHDAVVMCFVLAGEAEHLLEGQWQPLRAGTLSITHYGQRHCHRTPHGPIETVNIYLDPESVLPPALSADAAGFVPALLPLRRSLVHVREAIARIQFDEIEPMRSVVLELCRESGRAEGACSVALRAWYALLLTTCARRARDLGHRPAPAECAPFGHVEKLRCELDAHPEKSYELGELAARARMTPTSFCRAFKRHTGRTLTEYLHERRIERATALVQHDMSVAQAAFASGFQDISHFNRVFRRLCGCSPRAFRKRSALRLVPSSRQAERDSRTVST